MAANLIKTIFCEHWKPAKQALSRGYEPSHWEDIVTAVEKMLGCRDPANGFAEYICLKCGRTKKVAFTCKSRFCTSCGKRYVDEWVNRTVKTVIDVAHRHIVFTIPEELRQTIFKQRLLIKVMMDCAAKTALEVLQCKGSDAVPGILAVVHTFGRDLKFNPHVHMLMTEGGLAGDKEWEEIPFLPYDLLRRKWQYYLLTELKKSLPRTSENARFIDRLFKDNGKGFYVNGESKMTSARYTARYIGRYMGRPALAEYKITRYDGKLVTFWYESHETKKRVYQALPVIEFMKRLADHIPLKGFKMVRHYGLYARRTKKIAVKILAKCKRFIQQSLAFVKELPRRLSYRQRLIASFGQDPLVCPHCKKEMELWRIWHPKYGDIFDLGRDSPAIEPEYEKTSQKGQTESNMEKSGRYRQLCLFSV
ncbi:MAG: transposase [Candidatus Schekmanbacteria bacterium]|nr:transposase [Candidatus Schekmanbacteria bacterium]